MLGPRPELTIPEEPGPHHGPPAIGLVGTAIAVAGAGLMAAVLGQALFALFAAVGAVASLATWAIGSLGALRHRRRAAADHGRRLAEFVARLDQLHVDVERRHRADHLSIGDALAIVDGGGARLWERRPHDEPLRATIGPGTCRWHTGIGDDQRRTLQPDVLAALERCERMVDVAVPLTLPPASAVAFRGDPATVTALGRSVIVQLAALYGPCDWRLLVVTEHTEEWELGRLVATHRGRRAASPAPTTWSDGATQRRRRIVPMVRRPSSSPTCPEPSPREPVRSADSSPHPAPRASC